MAGHVIGSSQGTLGDTLWLTPLLQALPDVTLKVFDTPVCRNVAQVYKGLVKEIIFCSDPGTPPTTNDRTHVSQRMLNAVGMGEKSCIPKILLTNEEIEWARNFLRPYHNPVVFVNHNSGWKTPENWFARHVKPPKELMVYLSELCRRNYTVMQFCNLPNHFGSNTDNFDPLPGTVQIRGLTLRKQAACYHLIGKMITGDTGDPYLMLAAGGKVICLLADEVADYRYYSICYYDFLWKDEPIRTKYFRFSCWHSIENWLDFDL